MLRDEIKILSGEESELLKADRLPKSRRNKTGLYLHIGNGNYTAYDYSERQNWEEYFGSEKERARRLEQRIRQPVGRDRLVAEHEELRHSGGIP